MPTGSTFGPAVLVVSAIPTAEPVRLARTEYGGYSWRSCWQTPTLAALVHDEVALAEVAARVREAVG